MLKSQIFFVVLGLFGVNNALISIFFIFKVSKAKKAATVAGKAKLQRRKFVEHSIQRNFLNYPLPKVGQDLEC